MIAAQPIQWSIFTIDLEPAPGSETSGRSPVLVVSRESANQALPVVTVLPIAKNTPECVFVIPRAEQAWGRE